MRMILILIYVLVLHPRLGRKELLEIEETLNEQGPAHWQARF